VGFILKFQTLVPYVKVINDDVSLTNLLSFPHEFADCRDNKGGLVAQSS
jgi:hypothetical protein